MSKGLSGQANTEHANTNQLRHPTLNPNTTSDTKPEQMHKWCCFQNGVCPRVRTPEIRASCQQAPHSTVSDLPVSERRSSTTSDHELVTDLTGASIQTNGSGFAFLLAPEFGKLSDQTILTLLYSLPLTLLALPARRNDCGCLWPALRIPQFRSPE